MISDIVHCNHSLGIRNLTQWRKFGRSRAQSETCTTSCTRTFLAPHSAHVLYVVRWSPLSSTSSITPPFINSTAPFLITQSSWQCCRIFGLSQKLLGKADLKVYPGVVRVSILEDMWYAGLLQDSISLHMCT